MNDRYQEPMANGEDHPLKLVPQEILETARRVVREAAEAPYHDLAVDLAEPLADSVVMALLERGHLHVTVAQIVDEIERRDAADEVRRELQRRYSARRTAWIRDLEAKGYPAP